MSKQIQRRRGSNNDHAAFVGAQGEFTYNTDTKRIHAHDGLTAGGFAAMRVDELGATGGSALVGYDGSTVQAVLDSAKPIADYTALRAYTGRATQIRIITTGIAGFFYYDASDTTSADNGGTIIVASNGKRWKRLFDGAVNVKWFGAKGNGSDDDTSEVQAALNSGALRVIIPPGMTVGVTGLTMVANQTLEIQGKIKKLSGTAALISVASGCSVIGGEIDGNSVNCQGIVGSNTQNVTVRNVYVHNLGKVGIGSYAVGSASWVIQGNRIENTIEEGIVVEYTNDCLIENNRVDTALHGIRWWGGDSQVSNTLGIYGLRVHGNIVYGAMGGIWGSLGGNITVTGNHVENCSDVGFDFEGCADFTCTGNTAYECANGCYAVFFGSQRGSFSGNTARNVTSNGAGFYSDPTGTYSAGYIEITGNSFMVKTRCVYAGPNDSKSFSNSSITNNIFVSTGGFSAVEIAENTNLLISNNCITTVGSAVGIAFDGVSNSMVRDNAMFGFSDTNSNPANGGGITLKRRSASYPSSSNVVRGNRLDSYVYSIVDSCAADVTQSKNDIEHNHVLNVYRSTGGTYDGVIANNLNILTPATAVTATTF